MALERQNVPISLRGGVDTKTDPKQVVPGKLLTLENGVFTSPGRIRKRNGNGQQIATAPIGTNFLAAYGSGFVATDGANLYQYANGSLVSRDKYLPLAATSETVIQNQAVLTDADVAVGGGLECHVWTDSLAGRRYSVRDVATGQYIVFNAAIPGSLASVGCRCRVVAFGTSFVIFYPAVTTGYAVYSTISFSTPSSIGAAVALGVNITATTIDVVSTSRGDLAILLCAGDLRAFTLSAALVQSPVASQGLANGPVNVVGVEDSVGHVAVGYCDNAFAFKMSVVQLNAFNVAPTFLASNVAIDAAASLAPRAIIGWSSSAQKVTFAYDYEGTDPLVGSIARYWVKSAVGDTAAYTVAAPAVLVRGVTIASFPVLVSGILYFLAITNSWGANSCLLLRSDGTAVARLLMDDIGTFGWAGSLALTDGFTDTFAALVPLPPARPKETGSPSGLARVSVSFTPANQPASAQLGGCLLLGGGMTQLFDGAAVTEQGFHTPPTIDSLTKLVNVAGLPAGTYGYAVTYEWVDNTNALHRSAPSPVGSIAVAANDRTTLVIPTLRVTAKAGVQIVVYRTLVNGTTYYKLTGNSTLGFGTIANDPTVDSVSFTDTGAVTDAVLGTYTPLYTNGGVQENAPGPPTIAIGQYKNRAVVIDSERSYQVAYSKQVVPGSPVEFTDFNFLNIDPSRGGGCTAVAALDDKLILFKQGVVFFVVGDGPTDTGAANDFSTPVLINTNSGALSQSSVVPAAGGIIYQSAKGFFILDRALSDHYVGAEVEAYNGYTVAAAVQIPGTNDARFVMSSGDVLSYDYLVNQWSVFTGLAPLSACLFQNKWTMVKYASPNALVWQETPGTFTDAGAAVSLKLKTSWLSLAGLQGFQRAYKLMILGDYFSAHGLKVEIAVDFDSTIVQTVNLTQSAAGVYQWRIDLTRQKCQAIQVTLTDTPTAPYGESLAISGLTLEVGAKRGPFRPAAARISG